MNEKELLKELSKGNVLAFSQMVALYETRLLYFANHYLNDEETAKDIVQDVFSVLWEENYKLENVNNLSSWIYTLAKNLCLKKIDSFKVRRKYEDNLKHQQTMLIQDALRELNTSPAAFQDINTILKQTLSQLPKQSRRIFEMSRFENKKNKEIAEELNISIKTVEAAITKSLKLLRLALRHYLPILFI